MIRLYLIAAFKSSRLVRFPECLTGNCDQMKDLHHFGLSDLYIDNPQQMHFKESLVAKLEILIIV